jgi:hypothetical protein
MPETPVPMILALLLSGGLFGSMLFFAVVTAPTVFKALPEDQAGRFLRELFPRYYTWGMIVSFLAAVACVFLDRMDLVLTTLVFVLFVLARQVLMPRINTSRDAALAGDKAAARRFLRLHGLSVLINLVQMIILLAVFAHVGLY